MADSGMAVKDKVAFACLYLGDSDVRFVYILHIFPCDGQIKSKVVELRFPYVYKYIAW